MGAPMDEIAAIAEAYLDRHEPHALMLVEDQISRAMARNLWSEVLKWHRVRHRLQRLQMTRRAAARDGVHRAGDGVLPAPEPLDAEEPRLARPEGQA